MVVTLTHCRLIHAKNQLWFKGIPRCLFLVGERERNDRKRKRKREKKRDREREFVWKYLSLSLLQGWGITIGHPSRRFEVFWSPPLAKLMQSTQQATIQLRVSLLLSQCRVLVCSTLSAMPSYFIKSQIRLNIDFELSKTLYIITRWKLIGLLLNR